MNPLPPERWERVKNILQSALEHGRADQPGFVAAACSGDDALRHEVESLLAYQSREQGFIETSAAEIAVRLLVMERQRKRDDRNEQGAGNHTGTRAGEH